MQQVQVFRHMCLIHCLVGATVPRLLVEDDFVLTPGVDVSGPIKSMVLSFQSVGYRRGSVFDCRKYNNYKAMNATNVKEAE